MNILFIAPTYLGLYKPIYNELKSRGHNVSFYEDKLLPFDNHGKNRKPLYSRILFKLKYFKGVDYFYEDYWKSVFSQKRIIRDNYDLLFVINGMSLHPILIEQLKKKNPQIKTCLYIWDTCKYYDFARNIPLFEKVSTFDRSDANFLNVKYLPIYCPNDLIVSQNSIKYDAFCIGTWHDGRFEILTEIASQLDKMKLSYLFKVVYNHQKPSWKFFVKKNLHLLSKNDVRYHEYATGVLHSDLLTSKKIPVADYIKLLLQSQVVIDTDRESQTGLTPRLVWAIMAGKRVITTNAKLLDDPYCIGCDIIVIDRNKPVIRKEMFSYVKRTPSAKLRSLYLKEWVEYFIS